MSNEREELMALQRELEGKLQAVKVALELLGPERIPQTFMVAAPAAPKLKGLTQREALIALAQAQGGRIELPKAYEVLRTQGLIRRTDNWYNILHGALKGKFKGMGRGVYELLP